MSYKTDQENFWAGEFGTQYIERNQGAQLLASNLDFFSRTLRQARNIKSCVEFGANIGMNIMALQLLFPDLDAHGIEINTKAADQLGTVIPSAHVYNTSIFDFIPTRQWDTMGGVDNGNATGQVLASLQSCSFPTDLSITVVMGPHAPWLTQVREQATKMPWHTEVLVGVDDMARLMAESDLAIGAAGSTSWERCCLGLATIQIALAQNQVTIAQALSDAGAALTLPSESIAQSLPGLIDTMSATDKLHTTSVVSSTVTQGKGAALVSDYMKEIYENYSLMQ